MSKVFLVRRCLKVDPIQVFFFGSKGAEVYEGSMVITNCPPVLPGSLFWTFFFHLVPDSQRISPSHLKIFLSGP